MRLVEEITTPSAAAVAAVQAAREAEFQRSLDPTLQPDDSWTPAGDEVPAPQGLTATEAHQMEQLRDKYGRYQRERDGWDAPHTEEGIAAAQARMDAEFRARPAATKEDLEAMARSAKEKVTVCDRCRGMKILQEEYNNRVMERMCDRCDGEGVLVDGKPPGPPSGAPDPASNPSPFAPGEAAKVRVAVLARDIRRLERQMGKYNDELRDAMLRVEKEDNASDEEQALSEFIHQLQLQVRRLQGKAEEKQLEIASLTAAEEVEQSADDLP